MENLASSGQVLNTNSQKESLAPTRSRRKVVVILVIVVVVAIGAVMLGFYFTAAPTKVAKNIVHDLSSGKIDEVYSEFWSGLKRVVPKEEFQSALQQDPFPQITDVTFNSRSVRSTGSGSEAILSGYVTKTDGTTMPLEVVLIKENGDWKFKSIEY